MSVVVLLKSGAIATRLQSLHCRAGGGRKNINPCTCDDDAHKVMLRYVPLMQLRMHSPELPCRRSRARRLVDKVARVDVAARAYIRGKDPQVTPPAEKSLNPRDEVIRSMVWLSMNVAVHLSLLLRV